jgi:cryptochrome
VGKLPPPAKPLPPPTAISDPGPTSFALKRQDHAIQSYPDLDASYRKNKETIYESIAGPNGDFAVPTLEELGIPAESATTPHRGGESVALETLANFIADGTRTAKFSKPDTSPGQFLPPATTLLSPHLHFGTLSVRKFYHDVKKVIAEFEGNATKPPTSLEGQLLFREMYIVAHYGVPSYEQTRGNPYCRYMDWNLENDCDSDGDSVGVRELGNIDGDRVVQEWFTRWKEGRTGYPWIDALMRQLKHDGWIHQLSSYSMLF